MTVQLYVAPAAAGTTEYILNLVCDVEVSGSERIQAEMLPETSLLKQVYNCGFPSGNRGALGPRSGRESEGPGWLGH